jgi:hypothetical protein
MNDVRNFYADAEQYGIPIEYRYESADHYKNNASEIALSLKLLCADYSSQKAIDIICTFSSNPIGIVNSFIDYLVQVESDVTIVDLRMHDEKEQQIRLGVWSDEVDPRFANVTDEFNRLKGGALA